MGQVATISTPLTYGQALGALLAAGCPQSALLMVAAQSAVETAAWSARGFHNNNFGNVTPSSAQLAAGIDWMDQGIHGMKYVSFDDPVSGARAMLDWLTRRGLMTAATNNDLGGYMAGLRAGCYLGCIGQTDPTGHTVSQADYDAYQAGIASWMQRLSGVVPEMPSSPSVLPSLAAAFLLTLGVGALGALAWEEYKRPGLLLPWRV